MSNSEQPKPRVPCGKWDEVACGWILNIGEVRIFVDSAPYKDGTFYFDVSVATFSLADGYGDTIDAAKLAAEDAAESLAREILAGIGRG
jgi:hypothetical protein